MCPSVALKLRASLSTRSRAWMTNLDSMLSRVPFTSTLVNDIVFAF